MMLYHLRDWQRAALTPFRMAAEATQFAFDHSPMPKTHFSRAVSASAELFERTTRNFVKPTFKLHTTKVGNDTVAVTEEIVATKPFCNLIHFRRATKAKDPKVLIVAPMSGHHATLLRGTVEAMLPDHDVYITDWIDAKLVPVAKGKFDLEDNIEYIMDFIRVLGPDVHVMAICQPAVPVLCAVAVMAEMNDPKQAKSMTLMGGPIDTGVAPTAVTRLAEERPIEWFKNTVIHSLPFYYPGAHRLVYPGFMQLQGFVSMNVERHVGEHFKLFQNLVKGDDESVASHRKFYDEYLSVMDITAEFYLQTVERVFQRRDLPLGNMMWHGKPVRPQAIKKTALLTIEGELDDISAPGQTRPAHDLCSSLPEKMKKAHLQMGVGHYGIFNGRKWREYVQPVIAKFVRDNA
jgi:poly(3-hydroxybutyrate) depolymerase